MKKIILILGLAIVLIVLISGCPRSEAVCGDEQCQGRLGENADNCPADCGPRIECGNTICETGEDCSSCPGDCNVCPAVCDNGICESGESESCPEDCEIISTTNKHFGADLLWYGVLKDRTNSETLETFMEQTQNLQIEAVRFDVYWGSIEKERGNYDWSITDDVVNTVDSDTDIVFTLYSSTPWGSKYKGCRDWLGTQFGLSHRVDPEVGPPSSIPENMEEYMSFLEAIVNRYKDRVKYWQIENEANARNWGYVNCPVGNKFWLGPVDEYLELLEASYNKIKELDSTATVFATSRAFEQEKSFFWEVLDRGRDYSDLWDLHLYGGTPEDLEKISSVVNEMNRLGYSKKLWATEAGQIDITYYKDNPLYSTFAQKEDSAEELKLQSEETVKRYAHAFGEGIERVFMLRITEHNENADPIGNFVHMDLTLDRWGQQKKPAYYTYQIMYSKLAGFDSIQKFGTGSYKFSVDNRSVFVLWSDSGTKNIDLSSYTSASNVKVTHIITELGKTDADAVIETVPANSVRIDEAPVFVEES